MQSGKFRLSGLVAPESTPDTEVIVTTYGNPLIVREGVSIVGIGLEYARPLVAVIPDQANITVHDPRHGGVEVEWGKVKLRKVNILCSCGRCT